MILKIKVKDSWYLFENLSEVKFGSSQTWYFRLDTSTKELSSETRLDDPINTMRLYSQESGHDIDEGYIYAIWPEAEITPSSKIIRSTITLPKATAWVTAQSPDGLVTFMFSEGYLLNDKGDTLEVVK